MKTQNNYCRYPWLLWMVREKSGESGRCLFSQLLQWSAVIPNICKLKFVLSGMLGINDWLFLLVPNPPTAWHGSSPLKNQPNGIWDRFLDSPDMSAKSRMIKKQLTIDFPNIKNLAWWRLHLTLQRFCLEKHMRTRGDYCLACTSVGCTNEGPCTTPGW